MPEGVASARPGRGDWIAAAGVALVLLALYAATAPRTVATEDDGFFILSSYFLGVEHPPGYPLHTIAGKLITLIPFGPVAYRVHVLSGIFGALACAMLFHCARALGASRAAAGLAALGLGFSPTYWSQAIIAEVYTLNTLFLFVLIYLALRAAPPGQPAPPAGQGTRDLPVMAFVFGLSLSNHWPLMLLFAPAFIALLWPRIGELLRRLPLLVPLVALGLWPYAWMVFNSLSGPPASFDGPLESFADFWFFVSRAGYAGVDVSATSTWLDRIRFFEFQGAELLAQFAVAGTMVAAAGFAAQWSVLGRRISIGLTAGFLMTTACLLLLLGFDYDAVRKQMYSVYPLPAYGVAALWMAIGFDWLARRFRARATHAAIAGAALLAAILVAGSRQNLLEHYDWPARYAGAVLRALPRDAVVFVNGDPDLAPIAYLHMIEGRRPDITLYQPQGLILGNRLFHPLHTDKATASARIRELIDRTDGPVAFTLSTPEDYARKDHWLFVTVDKSSRDPARSTPEVPEELVRFFEDSLMDVQESNPWMAYFQGELRRRYGGLLAIRLARGQAPDARSQRQLDALARDYFGSLGVVEGMMANKQGYSVAAIARFLDAARDRMPGDIGKNHKARYFELRGYVRLETGDRKGGVADLEEAVSVWPAKANGAATALAKLYAAAGDGAAAERLQARLK